MSFDEDELAVFSVNWGSPYCEPFRDDASETDADDPIEFGDVSDEIREAAFADPGLEIGPSLEVLSEDRRSAVLGFEFSAFAIITGSVFPDQRLKAEESSEVPKAVLLVGIEKVWGAIEGIPEEGEVAVSPELSENLRFRN